MKALYHAAILVLAVVLSQFSSKAAERRWKPKPTYLVPVWSDPDNWEPRGIPQDGDDLIFNGGGHANDRSSGQYKINHATSVLTLEPHQDRRL